MVPASECPDHEAEACRSQSVRVSCSFCSHRNGWGSCVLPQRGHGVIVLKIEQAAAEEPPPLSPVALCSAWGLARAISEPQPGPRHADIWVTPLHFLCSTLKGGFSPGEACAGNVRVGSSLAGYVTWLSPGPPLCARGSFWNTAHLPHLTPQARAWHKSLHGQAGGDPEGTLHWSSPEPSAWVWFSAFN